MMEIGKLCDALGRKELQARLGVKRAAIANAVAEGKLPPRWYRVVSDLCAERGVECQDEYFNFVEPAHPVDDGEGTDHQPNPAAPEDAA